MINESLERQLQNLLSMQYSTAALRAAGPRGRAVRAGLTCTGTSAPRTSSCVSSGRSTPTRTTSADIESFPPPRRRAPGGGEGLHHPDQQAQPADQGGRRAPRASSGKPRKGARRAAADGAAVPGRLLVGAGQAGQRAGLGGRWHQRRLVSAGPASCSAHSGCAASGRTAGCAASGRGWRPSTGPPRPSSPHPRRGGRRSRPPPASRHPARCRPARPRRDRHRRDSLEPGTDAARRPHLPAGPGGRLPGHGDRPRGTPRRGTCRPWPRRW